MITLIQTHSKKFHCTYLLHYYPFDTQVKVFVFSLFGLNLSISSFWSFSGLLRSLFALSLSSLTIHIGEDGA